MGVTLGLPPKENKILRVFEKRLLKIIFGSKRERGSNWRLEKIT
jgi:hypothetical protein